jgi:hypothetical protein
MNTKSLLTRMGVPVLGLGLLGGAGATMATSASAATVPGAVHAVTHSAQHQDTTSGPGGGACGSSVNGPVWAIDNLEEQFTVVPVSLPDGANYQVTISVTGSFKGFADPGANGTTDPALGYCQALTSSGPVKGTIEYDVKSSTPPDPASLLPKQAPNTGLGDALSQLFDNQSASSLIVGGGAYDFSYQNGNYVQTYDPITNPGGTITGDVTGH